MLLSYLYDTMEAKEGDAGMRLLFAEDERDLNDIVCQKLRKEGYTVDACFDGAEALEFLAVADYDAVILDIMMPVMDGFAVLKQLRAEGRMTPVLFLSARDSIEDRVLGLDSGANDYLIKPFSFAELMARIRTMIRLSKGSQTSLLQVGDLTLDTATHTVHRANKLILLSAKEYALLEYMLLNKNIVLSRETIEEHIWDFDYAGGTNLVDVYISYLRKKIDGASTCKLIHTVRGSGYVIKEPS